MMVLGINSFFEHPSVAIISGGVLRFAVEDERFTGIKHGRKYSPHRTYLPVDALYAALDGCGVTMADVDEVGYSYNRWDHLTSLWGCFTGHRLSSFRDELTAFFALTNVPEALRTGYEIPERYRKVLDPSQFRRVRFREWNHHLSHAASAFFCSGFEDALVLVCDGAGERAATSVYVGRGANLRKIGGADLPHSLGIFYSMITKHLGFEPFADEFKVMGLAAYGEPRFSAALKRLVQLRPNGGYRLDSRSLQNLSLTLGPRRLPGEDIEQRHMDIARSAQDRLEKVLHHMVRHYARTTGLRRLCLAGGTFMNCVANGKLARLPEVEEVFVQPAANDAGTAVGAAALSWIRLGGRPQLAFDSACLGTEYDEATLERIAVMSGADFTRPTPERLLDDVALRLAHNEVGGVFRGRMEFGPRALGMRSVLASPLEAGMRDRLNKLKGREGFRPVAPIVTEEAHDEYFDGYVNRYMLFTSLVRDDVVERIPAAVHVDRTARVQTIRLVDDPFLHGLLERFRALTGVPVLINTSLNVRGKPIVESPYDALACLYTTDMDFLVLGGLLVAKRSIERSNIDHELGVTQ